MSCWKDAGFGPRTYYSSGNLERVVGSLGRSGPRAGLARTSGRWLFQSSLKNPKRESTRGGVGVAELVLVLVLERSVVVMTGTGEPLKMCK